MTDRSGPSVRPMTAWRLEWLRLTRTPRWIALFGVYLLFGLLAPVMARYMAGILERVQSEMIIVVPPPQPKDGIVNYLGLVGEIGLVVVVALAASAVTFDAGSGLAIFLRTRSSSMWALLRPRLVVPAAASVLAYTVGTLAAWYETALLLGPLPAGGVLAGIVCQAFYLTFAVAVVAAAASLTRGTMATVGIALGFLIVLSVAGNVAVLHDYLPSTLVGAPAALLTGGALTDYLPALAVSTGVGAALVAVAVYRLRRREI